jgi:hypothetical protein
MEAYPMYLVLLVLVIILLFGGGGYYGGWHTSPYYGPGIGFDGIVLVVLVALLLTGRL